MTRDQLEQLSLDELGALNAELSHQKEQILAEQLAINEVISAKTQKARLDRELEQVSKRLGIPVQEIVAGGIGSEERVGG